MKDEYFRSVLTLVVMFFTLAMMGQVKVDEDQNVGIGTDEPSKNAKLQIDSEEKGFLKPRLTNAQMNNIKLPITKGLEVFNTDENTTYYYDGVNWVPYKTESNSLNGSGERYEVGVYDDNGKIDGESNLYFHKVTGVLTAKNKAASTTASPIVSVSKRNDVYGKTLSLKNNDNAEVAFFTSNGALSLSSGIVQDWNVTHGEFGLPAGTFNYFSKTTKQQRGLIFENHILDDYRFQFYTENSHLKLRSIYGAENTNGGIVNNHFVGDLMTFHNSGNVGIGTDEPKAKLQIVEMTTDPALDIMKPINKKSQIRFSMPNESNRYSQISVHGSWNQAMKIELDPENTNTFDQFEINKDGDKKLYYIDSKDEHRWYLEGNEAMVLDRFGQVGVGISVPSEKLHVKGNGLYNGGAYAIKIGANIGGGPEIGWGSVADPNSFLKMGAWGSKNNIDTKGRDLKIYGNGGSMVYFDQSTTNIGIGVEEPTAKLHVEGKVRISDVLKLSPLSNEPDDPDVGDVYMDDGTNTGPNPTTPGDPKLRYYNGTTWVNL